MPECNICFEDFDITDIYFCEKYHYACKRCFKLKYCEFCTKYTDFYEVIKMNNKCMFLEKLISFFKNIFNSKKIS